MNTSDFELSIGRPPAEHLGNPEKFLELTAVDSDFIGTGQRRGKSRFIRREFRLELLEEDIQRILKFAVKRGLVDIKVRLTRGTTGLRRKQRND